VDEDAIRDAFASLGPVRIRPMFSGRAISLDGRTFALVLRGELFLKANQDTCAVFAAAGSRQFSFERQGRTVMVGYWSAPPDALDDPEEMDRWGRLALSVACPARPRKRKT
jgi:DNA transformation protein